MTLSDHLQEIRDRLESRSFKKDIEFWAHAPKDIYRLLRVVEVLNHALLQYKLRGEVDFKFKNGVGYNSSKTADKALSEAEQILRGEK
jgi:hypothetical protein